MGRYVYGKIPRKINLSERRKKNLEETFWWIDWDFNKTKCTYWGFGDYPQFRIPGKFEGLSVIFETSNPNGNSAGSGIIIPSANLRLKCRFKNAEKLYREWFTR
jgi:hypothetical protein